MFGFFLNILEITAGTSLLVLVMLLILHLAGKRFTSRCRYILWALVLLRLAIPFSFNVLPAIIEVPLQTDIIENDPQNEVNDTLQPDLDVTPTPPSDDKTDLPVSQNPTVPITPTNPVIPITPSDQTNTSRPQTPSTTPGDPVLSDPSIEQVVVPDPIPETPREPISILKILEIVSLIYAVGVIVFFAWNLLSYLLYTTRILRASREADEKTLAIFRSICAKENLKNVPELLVSPEINSPAAFGLFSHKIVLPDIKFTQNGLAGTLFHEVTHCKRGDLYFKVIELIARSLHWFNPLAHISAFRCEMEMEMSCDEYVLSGCNDNARAAYGEVMLDIIRRCRRSRGALTTHFNPQKNSVKKRFANIIYGSGKRNGKLLILLCLVLCVLAGTLFACSYDSKSNVKDYTINVLVDENVSDNEHNRNIHIIEVDLNSKHKDEINEKISNFYMDQYNYYLSTGSNDFHYQLIDTTYTVKNNILSVTGISRYSATSIPDCKVQTVFYDLANDRLFTIEEYIEAVGIDMDKAEAQITKILKPQSNYDNLEWEIISVVYPNDDPVLVVSTNNTVQGGDHSETVLLVDYNSDRYNVTYELGSFDGFDKIEWQSIPVQLSISYPTDDALTSYDKSKIIDVSSDDTGVIVALSSNVDVDNLIITELIKENLKITDCVPLHTIDMKADEPVLIKVSFPGTMGNRGITYTDTYGSVRRLEITKNGNDGKPLFIAITNNSLSMNFIGSDEKSEDDDLHIDPPIIDQPADNSPLVSVIENDGGLDHKTITIPQNDGSSMYEFDDNNYLIVTYGVERDAQNKPISYTDCTLYLMNTVQGTIVDYCNIGDLLFRPRLQRYTEDGIVLYDSFYHEETNTHNMLGALKVVYQDGHLQTKEITADPFPYYDNRLISPDGKYTVFETVDDGTGHGGIDVVYHDLRASKRILTNVMLDDDGVMHIYNVTGYRPIQFIDNNRLLYLIGGWEWAKGYGIYNLETDEKTEFYNGYSPMGYSDGYIYLSKSKSYETVSWYKADLSGNITQIASVYEEDGVLYVPNAREFKFGGTDWRNIYYVYSDAHWSKKDKLAVKYYDPATIGHSTDTDNYLAEVIYNCTNENIIVIGHENAVTAIIFDEKVTVPEITSDNTNDIFTAVLENKYPVVSSEKKQEMLLKDYLASYDFPDDIQLSINKYSIVDLNDDGVPEMVLWLRLEENEYYGFAVLHYNANAVYIHEFTHRAFNELKTDGTYTSSSSAFNMSILKLDFKGGACISTRIAHREGDGSLESITYYIEDRIVTAEEFEKLSEKQNQKEDIIWIDLIADNTQTTNDIFTAVMENKYPVYSGYLKQEMLLKDVLGDCELKKYTIIDMNDDGTPEMVLWHNFGAYDPIGHLVLHIENGTVYSYGFSYRGLQDLKTDGSFHWSGGAGHHGTSKLDFSGDTCTETYLAYCENITDPQTPHCYIGENSVSREEFEGFYKIQDQKEDVVWIEWVEDNKTYDNIEFYTFIDDIGGYTDKEYSTSIKIPSYCFRYNGVYIEPKEHANSNDNLQRVLLTSYPYTLEEFEKNVDTRETQIIKVIIPVTVTADDGTQIKGYYGNAVFNGETRRLYVFYIPTGFDGDAYALHLWQRPDLDGKDYFDKVIVPIVRSVRFTENSEVISEVGSAVEIYEMYGLKVRLPHFYYGDFGSSSYLTALTYIHPTELGESEIARFYQKYLADKGLGYLYSIVRHTTADMLNYTSDSTKIEYFAYDGTYFYGIVRPTDVQWDTENNSMMGEYERLSSDSSIIVKLFLDANDNLQNHIYFTYPGILDDDEINGVGEWEHIGKYVVSQIHVNPSDSLYVLINTETQEIENRFIATVMTCHSDDINTIVYTQGNMIKSLYGTLSVNLMLDTGEHIRGLAYSGDKKQLIVTIETENSSVWTYTIELFTYDTNTQMTKYTEIDEQTGYEVSFVIPKSWNYNTDGVLYDENGNKRIDAFSFDSNYPVNFFKDDLQKIAEGKIHNLDYAYIGTNKAKISYIGYGVGAEGQFNYYFCLNCDEEVHFYINIYGENVDNQRMFYNEYVLRIIDSVTIKETVDDEDIITDIADWDTLPWRRETSSGQKNAPNAYNFIYDLVSGQSKIPEYNGLGIKDYSIELLEDDNSGFATLRFKFTVTCMSLPETLLPGTHTWILLDGMDLNIYYEGIPKNQESASESSKRMYGLDRFEGNSAVQAVHTYLQMMVDWEISSHGEWDISNGILPSNYICKYYGNESMEISFIEMQRLLLEKFGISLEKPTEDSLLYRCRYYKATDTVEYADTRGYVAVHKFLDIREEDGITYVIVQLFADRHRIIPSHKVQYAIGEGEVFLGCEIIQEGKYAPRQLS
ncbi:MAG: hypothetical protein E7672_01660 [Ruminococcaceae bacterium]|nr:hypothetical protein [Oscillospiraceae bacterium]